MKNNFFKDLSEGVKDFTDNITVIVNTVLLFIVYILGIGLTFLFAKIPKKQFLDMETSEDTESYWSDLNLKEKPLEEYYRQF